MNSVARIAYPVHAGMADDDVLEVALAPRGASEVLNGREERDHKVRAALLGIEASAEELSRHCDVLTERQVGGLAQALAAEVRRLSSLRSSVLCGAATLYDEDRGRGITGPSPERVFERGERGDDSDGSGLGLRPGV